MTAGQVIRRTLKVRSELSHCVCGVVAPVDEFSEPRAATWLL
jgi:hypothetical protein